MRDEIQEALRTNNRINLLLLDAVSNEGLRCTLSKRGGRDVAQQLAHVHNVRIYHLERRGGKAWTGRVAKLAAKPSPTRAQLKKALNASCKALEDFFAAILEGEARSMKKGPINYLSYFVSHEAHHRGNILLTLKQHGHALDKDTRYAIWDWDRR